MADAKKFAFAVILLVVAIAAVVFAIRRSFHFGPAEAPQWAGQTPMEKIDQKIFQLMTKPLKEWQRLGQKDGKYKNPETSTYTMVDAIVCEACGEKIPIADLPKYDPDAGPESRRVRMEAMQNYRCPKCGKWPGMGTPQERGAAHP